MFRPSDKLKFWVIKLAAMKLLSGSNVKVPSPSLVVLGAGQPVTGRRRGGVGALVADRELARRHPLVEVVVEEDEALAMLLRQSLPRGAVQELVLVEATLVGCIAALAFMKRVMVLLLGAT